MILSQNNISIERIIVGVAILWFSLTAYFSLGYIHGDEHYQIIEFAGSKLGTNNSNELAWEYQAKIRSAIQPSLCILIFTFCDFISINDPYIKTFILRLITGLFSIFSIYYFYRSSKHLIDENYRTLFLLFSFFTWFLPFINVRFSSETWSGLFLLLAAGVLLKQNLLKKDFVFIGFLLGLSFLFRYQIGFAIIGILAWLVFIKKEGLIKLVVFLLIFTTILLLGAILDSWFYQEAVVTTWNYFKVNLVDGVADSFGISPWYYYIYFVFRFSFFPFGIAILISLIFLIIKKTKSILFWMILPFCIFHSFIGHKELRFLFPLVNFVPIVFFLALQIAGIKKIKPLVKNTLHTIGFLLITVNTIALITASLKPAGIGQIFITKKIHELDSTKNINLISYNGSNPFDPWDGLTAKFYMQPNVSFSKLIGSKVFDIQKRNFLVVKEKDLRKREVIEFINTHHFKKITQSVPEWFVPFLKIYGGYPTKDILILFSE